MYQGDFNKKLLELNEHKNWRILFGDENPDKRMRDIEYILRFCFLLKQDISQYSTQKGKMLLKKELNKFMGSEVNQRHQTLNEFGELFIDSIDYIIHALGNTAFKKTYSKNADKTLPFHPTIFDSISVCIAKKIIDGYKLPPDLTDKKRILLDNDEYIESITNTTTKYETIYKRFKLVDEYFFGDL